MRTIDCPQRVPFSEYRNAATITPLENHGRKAEVRWRDGRHMFVDSLGDTGLREAHKAAVNNALYYCEALLAGEGPSQYHPCMEPPSPTVLAEYPELAARFPIAAAYVNSSLSDKLIAELVAFGYRVHLGGDQDGHLKGKWWWTLTQPQWSGVESSPREFLTEEDAWRDAARAYRVEELEAA